jgi:hypothetical protein
MICRLPEQHIFQKNERNLENSVFLKFDFIDFAKFVIEEIEMNIIISITQELFVTMIKFNRNVSCIFDKFCLIHRVQLNKSYSLQIDLYSSLSLLE